MDIINPLQEKRKKSLSKFEAAFDHPSHQPATCDDALKGSCRLVLCSLHGRPKGDGPARQNAAFSGHANEQVAIRQFLTQNFGRRKRKESKKAGRGRREREKESAPRGC